MINRPDFINFDGNRIFEKTAIFISDPHFIHNWKILQNLSGKNIETFLLKLIFMEKNQKNTFLKFLNFIKIGTLNS